MTWRLISTCFHLPKLQSKRIWKAVHAEHSQTATTIFWKKMVLYAERVHISMHHAASYNIMPTCVPRWKHMKIPTAESSWRLMSRSSSGHMTKHDKTMQICQTYSIKRLIRYVKRNLIENMLTLSEMSNVKIFRLISTTESELFVVVILLFTPAEATSAGAPPADLSWPFCRIDVGVLMVFCVFVRDVCKSKIKATRLIFLKDFWCLHEWRLCLS